MKCIKRNSEIRRVENSEAEQLVQKGWAYCSKTLWKTNVSPAIAAPTVLTPDVVKTPKTKTDEVEKILKKKIKKIKSLPKK
jgi:hypothetical protein